MTRGHRDGVGGLQDEEEDLAATAPAPGAQQRLEGEQHRAGRGEDVDVRPFVRADQSQQVPGGHVGVSFLRSGA